jgi:hypothetical protein
MDRHGLLRICHKVNRAFHDTQVRRIVQAYEWEWDCTAVVYPESKCYFCKGVIRSPLVWLLRGTHLDILIGQLYFEAGKPVCLLHISHAHMMTSKQLCLGKNANGVDLLSSVVCPDGASINQICIPSWYKRYWNHDCLKMREFIIDRYNRLETPTRAIARLKELDIPWSISSDSAV